MTCLTSVVLIPDDRALVFALATRETKKRHELKIQVMFSAKVLQSHTDYKVMFFFFLGWDGHWQCPLQRLSHARRTPEGRAQLGEARHHQPVCDWWRRQPDGSQPLQGGMEWTASGTGRARSWSRHIFPIQMKWDELTPQNTRILFMYLIKVNSNVL